MSQNFELVKNKLSQIIYDLFLKHPNEQKLSYLQHLKRAWSFGFRSLYCFIILMIHGMVPKYFETDGSDMINTMSMEIEEINKNTNE